ncbi:MAG TPA: aldehyde dehydrogenase family protein, partial [Ktedonobacteraceae bacterium]|nr:aldehyde dehydrogenase family protein [Ktedonobacteraceae bacterium]
MIQDGHLFNYVGGKWKRSSASDFLDVRNPATGEAMVRVPLSSRAEVDEAARAAQTAFADWRRTPPLERVQYLFKFKRLLEEHFDDIARLTTQECGKTLDEARGELQRGLENVEVATGIPSLMMGYNVEDIARGIDEHMLRQPVGVVAAITPFNFPGMIPLWFLPYAIACGNCFILKPSEKVPMTMSRVFELVDQLGLPPGVLSLVNGAREAVEALLDHPDVRGISFVGSSPVAKYIYRQASANGKRVQCQGGAKNVVVVLPDADLETATRIVADSSFGCAGQRCLATSVAITVGEARSPFTEQITH